MDAFQRAGLTFRVKEAGPPDGDTVVLLHGFPQDLGTYDEVIPQLTAGGFRVLAPLQRGYSPGARPAGRAAYAMPELVADILALMDAAEAQRAHVVGHDWGGSVAWHLAGRHADRVRSLTVLSTPHPAAFAKAALRSAQGVRASYIAVFQLPWFPERLALARGGKLLRRTLLGAGLPPEVAHRYAERMLEPGALHGALAWYRGLPMSRGYAVGRIRVPTGFLWGRNDPVFTAAACELTANYVTSPYVERALPGVGHWIPETRPDDVASMVLDVIATASA